MSVFCPNCGTEMADDAKFCPNCGTANMAAQAPAPSVEPAVEEPVAASYFEEAPAPAPAAEPYVEPTPVYQYEQPSYSQPDYTVPVQPVAEPEGSKALAIVSLVCGILSLPCCCCGWTGIVMSIAAIVTGIIVLVNKKPGKGMALAGIICGGILLVASIVMTVLSAGASSALAGMNVNDIQSLEDLLAAYGIDM